MRRFTRQHSYHTIRGIKATAHMIRLPWALFLVLAKTESIFRRRTLGRSVHFTRLGASYVQQGELNRPTDSCVSATALAETVASAIEVHFLSDWAAQNNTRRTRMRRRQGAMEIVFGIEQRAHGGNDHRKVFRPASRHHRVRSNTFQSRNYATRWHR